MSIFTKGNWENRNVQYPKRRRLTEVEGQPNIYDVDREEGTIISEGSAFSAENMNGLENRIETAFDSIETKINTARAGVQLYSSNGSNGTITLSDNVSNYDYLEIYYKEEQAESFHCIKVIPTFKPKWQAMDIRYSSNDGYMVFNVKKFTITGTTITQSDGKYANFKDGGITNTRNELRIYILKVKGYKNNI